MRICAINARQWFEKTAVGRFITGGIFPGRHTVLELVNSHGFQPEQTVDGADWLYFQNHGLHPLRDRFADMFLYSQQSEWCSLRELVDTAWGLFLRRQGRHIQRMAPDSTVIALLPCFRDVLILGDQRTLDVQELLRFMSEKVIAINRWNTTFEKSVMDQIVQREHDPALVEFLELEGQPLPLPSDDGLERRDDAVVEVLCGQCGESFSSVATAMYHLNRYGTYCIQRFLVHPTLLTLVSSPASIGLICATDKEPTATSCHEMDSIWAGYRCSSCSNGFKGNWRECVKHYRRAGHHIRAEGQLPDYRGMFVRLEASTYDLCQPYNDKPAWTCGHCSRFVCRLATRTQIVDHVARVHNTEPGEQRVPDDFYYVGP
ncbi:hypothetical protein V5O48_005258 [Marasmius crinis-equi]|uniref:C2H2-type domain-containing protein n=1 Tax=Marasmius crinis-equi TaxID=585013 RepID=A0ABR3FMT5_9AGAR